MKNAVLLAPYFLPRRRVGSWRPFKFAIHLRDFGWQPHVIMIQDSSAALTAKEQRLLEGITVHELTPLFDFTSRSGSQLSYSETQRAHSGSEPSDAEIRGEPTGGKGRMLQPALDWIDKQFPADTWLPFFWLKYSEITEIVERVQPEVLWSTGDPWSGHWIGKKLHERFTVPWVADFRDPWTLGKINLKNRSAFSEAIDKRMEAGVMAEASLVTFTSKATENLYARHYPAQANTMHTIYNAFDRELYIDPEPQHALSDSKPQEGLNKPESQEILSEPEPREEQFEPQPTQKTSKPEPQKAFHEANPRQALFDARNLNLLFFGKFRRLSPARPFIDMLAEIKDRDAKAANRIKMHSFGPLSESDKKYALQKKVLNNFIRLQPIPGEKMLFVLPDADILWLSTDADRKHIIPAKLWDYLAARRPVLSIAPNPEIAQILDDTKAGEQSSQEQRDELVTLLLQCVAAKGKSEKLPIRFDPDNAEIAKYEAHYAAQSLAELFDTLV